MKKNFLIVIMLFTVLFVTSCSKDNGSGKKIIRVGHNQAETHPTHTGLLAFEKYIESELGDKYDVQIFANELLGSQKNMVELNQTGAIEFVVASNAILESFDNIYEIFNLPFLFNSAEHYHKVMNDENITDPIFTSTEASGFEAVAWLDAGTRNFYTKDKPINTPEDLKGLKMRVQQGETNVKMMQAFDASAAPMGFGEVYTALQSGVIDGAENNELALTSNAHGDICKFYSYDMHQMVPDIVIGNLAFLNDLSAEEREIFNEGFKILGETQRDAWEESVQEAKDKAENEMGVQFIYPDVKPFMEKVLPLHKEVLANNHKLPDVYKKIIEIGNSMEEENND